MNGVQSKRYVHILIPGTSECDLIWKKRISADVIKIRILKGRDHPGLSKWALM